MRSVPKRHPRRKTSLSHSLSLSRRDKKKRERVSSRGRLDERGRFFPVRQSRRFFVGRDPRETFGYNVGVFFLGAFFLFFFVQSRVVWEKKTRSKKRGRTDDSFFFLLVHNIFDEDSLSA